MVFAADIIEGVLAVGLFALICLCIVEPIWEVHGASIRKWLRGWP